MNAIGWLATRWLRRRWVAAIPVMLIVAVGATGATLALSSARYTARAYGDYLDRANVGDVVVNPSFNTREIDEVIRSLPNVVEVTSAVLFGVSFDEGEPRSRLEVDGGGNVWGSHDGRYSEMDRPVVQSGRLPVGPSEAVVNVETAQGHGIAVGDMLPIAFWQQGVTEGLSEEAYARLAEETIRPIGVEHVRVVGIVTLPDEVLPDDLSPRDRVIVSPDIAARYDCLPQTPTSPGTFAEVAARMLPEDCAALYRYYSLSLAGGAADVKPTIDELVRQATVMNEQLVGLVTDLEGTEPPSYFVVPTETAQERDRVEHSNRPTVAAFVALGLATAFVTIVLVGLAIGRDLRRTRAEQRQWHQLGVSPPARSVVIGTPLAAAVAGGLVIALVAGWVLDPGPVGLVGVLQPRADRQLSNVGLAAVAGIGLAAFLLIAALASRSSRQAQASSGAVGERRTGRRLPIAFGSPVLIDGVRAAYRQPSAVPVVAGIATLTAAFMAATVFAGSLSTLTSTPRLYGWPWDVAAMTGAGYGDLNLDAARTALDSDPDVEHWAALGFLTAVSLDNEPMMAIVGLGDISTIDLTVRSGRLPTARDEIAIGATTAADRGLDLGDSVELGGGARPQTATITGIVVFPALGPLFSDRVGTGTGLLLPQTMIEAGDAQLGQTAADLATFIGVDVRVGADTAATISRLEDELRGLDMLGAPALTYPTPVRPPGIVDAGSTRTVPTTVGAVFAVGAAFGLAFASWASVRSRRRQLAVMQSLGLTPAQVRRSIRVQSLTTVLCALVIGVPIGVVGGRALWRLYADQLGVVADPAGSWTPMLLATAGGCVLALAAAQLPAVLVSRSRPAGALRAE